MPVRPVNPRRVIVAVVVLGIWGLITHGTFAGSGDEPHYLIAAHSLAFDGDFDVSNDYAENTLSGGRDLEPGTHARRGVGNVLRPVHDVGLPIVFAPLVRFVYPLADTLARIIPAPVLRKARLDDILILRHLISLAMALLAAALALQLFAIVRRATSSDKAAAFWAVLIVLSPPLLSVAFLFFTELPSALLVVWLFRRLSEPDERKLPWAVIGAATAFLLLVHVRNAAVVLGLLVWAIVRLRQTKAPARDWVAWGVAVLAVMGLRTAIVFTFWGTWLTTPMAVAGTASTPFASIVRETFVRISGLLFDQEFGLLPYAPIYLLLGPAVLRGPGRMVGGWWALGLAAAYGMSIVVPYINIHGWIGGWSPPARMITPIVPLLALLVVDWALTARGVARVAAAALVTLQIAIDLIVWQWPKALWNYEDGTSALLAWAPALQQILPAWNGPSPSVIRFVIWLAGWAILSVLVSRLTARVRS